MQMHPSPVRQNTALSRFECDADGATAVACYRLSGGVMTFTHTEVPEPLRGHGIAGRLVRGALEAARAQGLEVVALCPYVSAYIARHPEFQDLVKKG
jgi:predicted GNAT family acetyltransferase